MLKTVIENKFGRHDGLPLFTASVTPAARRAKAYLEDRVSRSAGGMITEVVSMTPELAELLLDRNKNNRPVRESTIGKYATDMVSGAWTLNGEAIKVGTDGDLIDGQHRLNACIGSGCTFQTMIVFGLAPETRVTMDQGAARTAGDYLKMEFGDADSNNIAAAAHYLWAYENRRPMSSVGAHSATKAQIRDVRERHPGLVESAKKVGAVNSKRNLSRSELIFFHYVASKAAGEDAATTFVYLVRTGDELKVTDPIYRYRERVFGSRLRRGERIELLFRTWNAWRKRGQTRGPVKLLGELPDLEA
jgi:hypothetical protein